MGWAPMVACTAWKWLWRNPLDNVHSDPDGDFSEVEKIKQTGALIIGITIVSRTAILRLFIELINFHTQRPAENEVIFVQGTGQVYSERDQMLGDIILRLAKKWS